MTAMITHGNSAHPASEACALCRQAAAEIEKLRDDLDENVFGREMKTPCYITFYTDKGYALRESMVSQLNHMDGRLHRQCERKARELGAASYSIFKHWVSFDVPPEAE